MTDHVDRRIRELKAELEQKQQEAKQLETVIAYLEAKRGKS
jgi:predicted RNase H-like nuclease (RuvC/YqgF family)